MPLNTANGTFGASTNAKDRSGYRSAIYIDANGKRYDCKIVGPGSSSGVKIALTSRMNNTVDNVPKGTTLRGTGPKYLLRSL